MGGYTLPKRKVRREVQAEDHCTCRNEGRMCEKERSARAGRGAAHAAAWAFILNYFAGVTDGQVRKIISRPLRKIYLRAYFEEAKWFHQGYVATMEEYLSVALVTGAHKMVATTSFVGMGEVASEEAFDWVSNNPLIVQVSSVIGRLMDDMVGHKIRKLESINENNNVLN
ncbi:hypothetical protein HYC85_004012 [Camellia sinensis]|uniref:Terpene synthase metal-binding domain-containing protein n=1 Tax=Camellia sinensis TaxID=4442 RepID=A0A7J7HWJ0_CAMSI|nr:hypothetical protein HYC85_004012 [Camellia sinensis]